MATFDKRGRSWRARVRLKGFKEESRTFDTRREAEVWAHRLEQALLANADTRPDLSTEMTLAKALDRYKTEETINKKGSVQETRRIEAWKKHALGAMRLSLLRPQHFVEYRKTRLQSASKNTVRLDLALISALFNLAKAEWGMPYLKNPVSMRGLSGGKGRRRRLDKSEQSRFKAALNGRRNKLVVWIVRFALQTAARQGEILRLRREDVHLATQSVYFRDTKNGDDRMVPLSKEATAILKDVLKSHDNERVFPISRNALVSAWRRTLSAAKIADFRFHDLRHEATSRLFERGLDIMDVQRITGHKTLSMLLWYTHLNVSHVVRRLNETDSGTNGQLSGGSGQKFSAASTVGRGSKSAVVIPFRRPGVNP